VYTVQC